jgi:hypothetical protein
LITLSQSGNRRADEDQVGRSDFAIALHIAAATGALPSLAKAVIMPI